MKIRAKIIFGFVLIAVMGLALGIVGIISNQTLVGLSAELRATQTTSGNVVNVLNAHYVWRQGLTEAVLSGGEFSGSLDPNGCAFGSWLQTHEAQSITDTEVLSLIEQVKGPHNFIHTEAANIVQLISEGNTAEAQTRLTTDILPRVDEVTTLLGQVQVRYGVMADELSNEIVNVGNQLNVVLITLVGIAVLVCIVVAVILINWIMKKIFWYENILDCVPMPISVTDNQRRWTFINKPVETMLNVNRANLMGKPCSNWGAGICNTNNCGIDCLARGQCTTNFEQGGMDFKVDVSYLKDNKGRTVGHIEMVQDISEMVRTQKQEAMLVDEIGKVSAAFVNGSSQISNGAQALAQGSTQQAAAIQELSGSISEITERTKRSAEMAEKAASLADDIKDNAEKGSHQMSEMTAATKEISDASHSISNVIKTIDDIAFQTNILALNAAVEAARAGEHGKGFAVVADEVRSLAAKSAEAAKNTESLIANSIQKSELGVKIAEETAASLTEIVAGINESDQLMAEIASEAEAQALGITQINTGIDQVAHVVQQNSATAEQSAAASQEMHSQATMLESLVNDFHRRNQTTMALPPAHR